MITARSIAEYTNSQLAFSKVIILNFKKMAEEVYFKGWEGAKLAYKSGGAFIPIACITSRSEGNATNLTEKSTCTEGKTVSTPNSITRTVSISGEVVDTNSLEALRLLQKSLAEQTFKVYRGASETEEILQRNHQFSCLIRPSSNARCLTSVSLTAIP